MRVNENAQRSYNSAFMIFAGLCLVTGVLHIAREILIPLALAVLLSFLLGPLVTRLEKVVRNRIIAVSIATLFAFSLLGGIGWVITDQASELATNISSYKQNLKEKIRSVRGFSSPIFHQLQVTANELESEFLGEPVTRPLENDARGGIGQRTSPSIRPPTTVTTVVTDQPSAFGTIRDTVFPLVSPFVDAGLVIVFVIFMLVQREDLRDRLIRLIGRARISDTTKALNDAAQRVSSYLAMQLMINVSYGLLVAIGLAAIGIPNAVLWGLLGVILRFLPYVGPTVVAGVSILLSLVVSPNWVIPIETAALFIVIELVTNNLLEPLLLGRSVGISAFAVVVSAVFWTWIWGATGLVLATPLTVCILVVGKNIPQLSFLQVLLGDEPALEPHVRLYQRLLADDRHEVQELMLQESRTTSLLSMFDLLVVPAMVLLEADHARERVSDEDYDRVLALVRELIDDSERWVGDGFMSNGLKEERAESETPHSSAQQLTGRRVVCLPAHSEAEELVGSMLAVVLRLEGCVVEVLSAKVLSGEVASRIDASVVDLVIVSTLPPSEMSRAYYVCKRLGSLVDDTWLLVGLWNTRENIQEAKPKIPLMASIVTTLREAVDDVRRCLPKPVAQKAA